MGSHNPPALPETQLIQHTTCQHRRSAASYHRPPPLFPAPCAAAAAWQAVLTLAMTDAAAMQVMLASPLTTTCRGVSSRPGGRLHNKYTRVCGVREGRRTGSAPLGSAPVAAPWISYRSCILTSQSCSNLLFPSYTYTRAYTVLSSLQGWELQTVVC